MLATQKGDDGSGTKIIDRLTSALKADGDFPVRAKVVTELRNLAGSPNTQVEQISELILREPSLGTRVLSLVNSSFYQRSKPTVTISQAVMQLGMKAISDLCAGLVLMQKFVPAAKRGGIFADAVKRCILTSLISNKFAAETRDERVAETGYLAGTFYNIGYLLLAFYFPQVFETAAKRAKARGQNVTKSISEILGVSPTEIATAIVRTLGIPEFYSDVIREAYREPADRKGDGAMVLLADIVGGAGRLADVIVDGNGPEDLKRVIGEITSGGRASVATVHSLLDLLPEMFQKHCDMIELGFLELPEFVVQFRKQLQEGAEPGAASGGDGEMAKRFALSVEELKGSIKAKEPISSVLTLAMETVAFVLGFERVVLLYADSDHTVLMGRMGLGTKLSCDPKAIRRQLRPNGSDEVDNKAFLEGTAQFFGEPLFADGYPFVALPVGLNDHKKGVLYADHICPPDALGEPLSDFIQVAVGILTDLIEQSVASWE